MASEEISARCTPPRSCSSTATRSRAVWPA
jgi:hypothetical protein